MRNEAEMDRTENVCRGCSSVKTIGGRRLGEDHENVVDHTRKECVEAYNTLTTYMNIMDGSNKRF